MRSPSFKLHTFSADEEECAEPLDFETILESPTFSLYSGFLTSLWNAFACSSDITTIYEKNLHYTNKVEKNLKRILRSVQELPSSSCCFRSFEETYFRWFEVVCPSILFSVFATKTGKRLLVLTDLVSINEKIVVFLNLLPKK